MEGGERRGGLEMQLNSGLMMSKGSAGPWNMKLDSSACLRGQMSRLLLNCFGCAIFTLFRRSCDAPAGPPAARRRRLGLKVSSLRIAPPEVLLGWGWGVGGGADARLL